MTVIPQPFVIKKKPENVPLSLDFWQLRREGIDYIIRLGSDFWTDYNLHDPGITILEVLCWAITDLSYRTQLPIGDLLADKTGAFAPADMPTPSAVLSCNPLTINDFRKILIDIDGVRNAWIEITTEGEIPFDIKTEAVINKQKIINSASYFSLNGLYKVHIDLDETCDCGTPSDILKTVSTTLSRYRNLSEDFVKIKTVETVKIQLCMGVDIADDVDPNDFVAALLLNIQLFLTPHVPFRSLVEMVTKRGASLETVFDGPILNNGFIDENELEVSDLQEEIHISDLFNIVKKIDGVQKVQGVSLRRLKEGKIDIKDPLNWGNWLELGSLSVNKKYKPLVILDVSKIQIFKRGTKVNLDAERITNLFDRIWEQSLPASKGLEVEPTYPSVVARSGELGQYFSIQNDFPHCYHIGKEGLDAQATALRRAQVKQLKGFLMFFDQILANYLAQLVGVRDMLSLNQSLDAPTRFGHDLQNDVPYVADLLSPNYADFIKTKLETPDNRIAQRHALLNHLIARFAETFSDYALTIFSDEKQNLKDKIAFLKNLPDNARSRATSFDYFKKLPNGKPDIWATDNVEGLKRRVCGQLGIADFTRHTLTCRPNYTLKPTRPRVKEKTDTLDGTRQDYSCEIISKGESLLYGYPFQPTEQRRDLQQKQFLNALTQADDWAFFNALKDLNDTKKVDELLADKDVIRSDAKAVEDNKNFFLQRDTADKTKFWLGVLNDEERIVARSRDSFSTVGQVREFLLKLKALIYNDDCKPDGFHIVEHILLRPRCEDCWNPKTGNTDALSIKNCEPSPALVTDPYSMWISVIASKSMKNYGADDKQSLFEQTVRAETPAHLGVRICWLDNEKMFDFEQAYGTWLTELDQFPADRCNLDEATKQLIQVLNSLDCSCCGSDENKEWEACTQRF
jgi:uncharacterized protein